MYLMILNIHKKGFFLFSFFLNICQLKQLAIFNASALAKYILPTLITAFVIDLITLGFKFIWGSDQDLISPYGINTM